MAGDADAHRGAYPLRGCRNLFLRVELAYAARCFEIFPDGRRLSGVSDAFPCCRISKQAASDIMLPVRSLYVHRHVLGSIRADISKRSNRTGILSGLGRQHDPVPPAPARADTLEFMGDPGRRRRSPRRFSWVFFRLLP